MARDSNAALGYSELAPTKYTRAVRFPSGRIVRDNPDRTVIENEGDFAPDAVDGIRLGVMYRTQDESGVSGTGVVADFAHFQDSGRVVIEWRNDENDALRFDETGVDIRPTMAAAVGIHGHGGRTEFRYDDGEVAEP